MKNQNAQLKILLPKKVYRKLQSKCTSESISMQDFLTGLITDNMTQPVSSDKPVDERPDKNLKILNTLNECPVFNDIDRSELKQIAGVADFEHYDKGRIIVWEEEDCDTLKIISRGSLKVFKTSPAGKEIILEILSKGETLIGPTLLNKSGSISSIGARALEETDIISIKNKKLPATFANNTLISTKLSSMALMKINALLEKFAGIITDTAEQRVIKVINELNNKYGNDLNFTQKEIAGMSVTTGETVSRVMSNLQKRGALKISRGKITILNKHLLSP